MRRNLIGILSLLFFSFLFAVPVGAFDKPDCAPFPTETTEFTLIAEDNIIFEPQAANSGRVIVGNVLVTSFHPPGGTFNNTGIGFVRVGSNTTIDGSVIADVLFLPDAGAPGSIKHCIANQSSLGRIRLSAEPAFPSLVLPLPTYATAHPTCVGSLTSGLCGPNPVVNNCTNGLPPLTVGVVFPNPLAPGCYGPLTIQSGAVLQLAAGVYTFPSVKMNAGARLVGPVTAGAPTATVNVNVDFKTDAGVFISDIKLNVARDTSAEVVKILNNSVVTNVVINAPFGKCHLHTGASLVSCSEVCCEVQDIEPITASCIPPPCTNPDDCVCQCKPGFHFEVSVCAPGVSCDQARSCVPD